MSTKIQKDIIYGAMANKEKIASIWRGLFFLAIVGWTLDHCYTLYRNTQSQTKFIVVDSQGTFYLSPDLEFDNATDVHARQTRLAMETLFNRGPNGMDRPKQFQQVFSSQQRKKMETNIFAKEAKEFTTKQIHQKIECREVKMLQLHDKSVVTGVSGQLIRNGMFQGKPFIEVFEITARFKFILNDDLKVNGMYPTVVVGFDYKKQPSAKV